MIQSEPNRIPSATFTHFGDKVQYAKELEQRHFKKSKLSGVSVS